MFNFTSPSWSVNPRSQCTGRAGEEELSQVLVQVCGAEQWELQVHGAVLQSRGHSPTPGCSLHGHSPAGSRAQSWQFFQDSMTSDHSCTGFHFRRNLFCFHKPLFPKRLQAFQGLGRSSSASNSSATGQTTFLQCQPSHLLLSKSSQKISSRRSNTLVYSLQGVKGI